MKPTMNLPKYREVLGLYQEALKKMPDNPSSIELAGSSFYKTIISYLEETLRAPGAVIGDRYDAEGISLLDRD